MSTTEASDEPPTAAGTGARRHKERRMAEHQHVTLVREVFDALNRHDVDRYTGFLADDFVWESDTLPDTVQGPEGARRAMEMYFAAFPDLEFEVDQILSCGAHVVAQWRASERPAGLDVGFTVTQRGVKMRGCTVCQVRGGKLTHAWVYWDTGLLRRRLEAPAEMAGSPAARHRARN
jgi:steroid delta-isomerase-like uncharacterized protein